MIQCCTHMNQNQWNRNTMRLKFKWHQVSLKEFDFPMVHSDINALQCVNIDGMNAIINICDGFCHRPNFWVSDAMTQFEFDCVRAWIISRCVLYQSFRSDCNLATEIAGNCSHVSFQPPLFSDRLKGSEAQLPAAQVFIGQNLESSFAIFAFCVIANSKRHTADLSYNWSSLYFTRQCAALKKNIGVLLQPQTLRKWGEIRWQTPTSSFN